MTLILTAGERQINLSSPVCMGILNITPDSFSDGAQLGNRSGTRFVVDVDKALRRAEQMLDEGALILDIGGESTRPGADAVSSEEETDRVVPVISALRERFDVCLSVDTSSPPVMQAAISAGADIVNDVRALSLPGGMDVVSNTNVAVCLMHMQGEPRTMQQTYHYTNVVDEVAEYLRQRLAACAKAGIAAERLIIDPGFGFGKSVDHNFQLLKNLQQITRIGVPVLIGVSRKSMIGAATGRQVDQRLAGSIAATTLALQGGAHIIRTHDVAATIDAIRVHSTYSQADDKHDNN